MKFTDQRTKFNKDIGRAIFLFIGLFAGIIFNSYRQWEIKQQAWLDSQVKLGTKLISPVPQNDLVFHPVYAQEALKPTPTPTTQELVTLEITRVFGASSIMHKIAKCESGLNPNAKNPTSSATGVFQIMSSVHGVSQRMLKDYKINIAVAKKLYDEQGTNPWISSINCWSK